MRLFPVLLFSALVLRAIAWAGCLAANGDYISGRDLAQADIRFSSLPATLQLGYAPLPGTARTFTPAELQRIARTNGINTPDTTAEFVQVCFEVPLHVPKEADFIDALRRALPQEATMRILDLARAAVPAGAVEFPLSGLEPPVPGTDGTQLWRGFVQYTGTRRVTIWARVVIKVPYTAVVSRKNLAIDTPIDAASLQIETKTGPLRREAIATRIEDVAGRVVLRPVSAGAEVPLSLLDAPPVIRRGDSVRVEVQSGSAVLRFDAIAETTARAGDLADFRNPVTGKTFRARAESGSRAVVIVGRSTGL